MTAPTETANEVRATWRRLMQARMAKILDEHGRDPTIYDETVEHLADVVSKASRGDYVVLAVRSAHEGFVAAALDYWNRVVAVEVGKALRTRRRRRATVVNVFTHGTPVRLPVPDDDPDGLLLLDEAVRVWARLQDEICRWTSHRRVALALIDSAQFTFERVTRGHDDNFDLSTPIGRPAEARHRREERQAS